MNNKITKIRQLIKKRFEENDWKYHIIPVVKYAKKLAKIYKVNEEIVELAALLHDIGRVKFEDDEEHHLVGVPEAEKILKKYNYSEKVIAEIKHCVESHSVGKGPNPRTMIAKIIANADAMAHFDALPIFFFWGGTWQGNHGWSFKESLKWVDDKIKRDWNKKITLPEAKKMAEDKYKAIRLILDSLKTH
jgi:putative nucleotidyltransferase with HDIG domain